MWQPPRKRHCIVSNPCYDVWHMIRGPFYRLACAPAVGHKWERFDYDSAGCLSCGALHNCAGNSVDNACDLEVNEDGSVSCTVTGFCVPVVRYCATEYVDTCERVTDRVDSVAEARVLRIERLQSVVHSTVLEILMGKQLKGMRVCQMNNLCYRVDQAISNVLSKTHWCSKRRSLCVQTMMARAMAPVVGSLCVPATGQLVDRCVDSITKCLLSLDMADASASRVESLSIGLLYLLQKGVSCGDDNWLGQIPELRSVLPPVNLLGKWTGFSSKLPCSTENEIKLGIRRQRGWL